MRAEWQEGIERRRGNMHHLLFGMHCDWDQTYNTGMYSDWELNTQPFGLWDNTQSNEPQQPGAKRIFLNMLKIFPIIGH